MSLPVFIGTTNDILSEEKPKVLNKIKQEITTKPLNKRQESKKKKDRKTLTMKS